MNPETMLWALAIYTIGVYATWSWRIFDHATLISDSDDVWLAYAWPILAIAYLWERILNI